MKTITSVMSSGVQEVVKRGEVAGLDLRVSVLGRSFLGFWVAGYASGNLSIVHPAGGPTLVPRESGRRLKGRAAVGRL